MEQSTFNQNQEILMPPPEVEAKMREAKIVRTKKKLPLGLVIGGGLLGLVLLLVIVKVILNQRKSPEESIVPTPTPKPLIQPSTKQSEWQRIGAMMEAANPEDNGINPPITDMKIEF